MTPSDAASRQRQETEAAEAAAAEAAQNHERLLAEKAEALPEVTCP